MDLHTMAETLRKVPMFSKLMPAKLKLLAFTSELMTFENGELVFNQGDGSDCAYVVMDGALEIITHSGDTEAVVAVLQKNDLVGELGVLTNAPRSATIRARGEVQALRIDADMFVEMITENPDIALDVLRQLSMKVTRTHELYEEVLSELAQARAG
jgi:CRP-like cAMP-binding protein